MIEAEPNAAHFAIAELQNYFNVQVVTQNVDDLHERAGATNVLHLHGNIRYARSTGPDQETTYPITGDTLNYPQDTCIAGFPLRPHIVWFGESVPMIDVAAEVVKQADIVIVVGTSLQVYPAASLIYDAKDEAPVFYIDPNPADTFIDNKLILVREKATVGFEQIKDKLIAMA